MTLVVESLNLENPLVVERGLLMGDGGTGRWGATLCFGNTSLKGGGGLGGCSLRNGTIIKQNAYLIIEVCRPVGNVSAISSQFTLETTD